MTPGHCMAWTNWKQFSDILPRLVVGILTRGVGQAVTAGGKLPLAGTPVCTQAVGP
jgi:hypothetical protein